MKNYIEFKMKLNGRESRYNNWSYLKILYCTYMINVTQMQPKFHIEHAKFRQMTTLEDFVLCDSPTWVGDNLLNSYLFLLISILQ